MRFFKVFTVGEVAELMEAQLLLSSLVSTSTKPLKVITSIFHFATLRANWSGYLLRWRTVVFSDACSES